MKSATAKKIMKKTKRVILVISGRMEGEVSFSEDAGKVPAHYSRLKK